MEVWIRPLEYGDAAAVQRYASDEQVARTTTIPWPFSKNGGEEFVKRSIEARQAETGFAFAIIADGELVGVVELNAVDYEKRTAPACLQRNPASGRVLEKNGFSESEAFIYSSAKFKDEPARRFRLPSDEWVSMNPSRRGSGP